MPLAKRRREATERLKALLIELEGKDIVVSYCGGNRSHWWFSNLRLNRLKVEIKMQRLIQLMTGEEGVVTDAEALAYVSNASLSMPLDSEWIDIYQYLLTKVMKDKVPDELRKESLDDWQKRILRDFKQWLWQQRIKGRKQKVKEERAKAKAEAEAKALKQLRLGV